MEDNRFLYTKITWYLVILTITLLLLNIFSMARYSSAINSISNLAIADPIIEIEYNNLAISNLDVEPQEIVFYVKNFKDDKINEVALNYVLKFETEQNTPIIVKELYKTEDGEKVPVEIEENQTKNIFIKHSERATQEFVALVSVEDVNYSNVQDNLKIIIEAEQKID